ncbi:uncharacterized protein [Procambarus clarkii]|uniref:uncharacterized protein n=1 Tax=Procambarus clarkii TaxID=6728 RepID=UPI003743D129
MDTVALQETRLPATGSTREKDFTFFWQGKPPEEVREHGVDFAIRNRLLGSIVPPTEWSARIITLQLHTAAGMVSLINAYSTTLTSSTEAKDEIYDDLGLALRDTPQQEPDFLLGDFDARVGSDHSSWPSCLGQFGFGKMNESGQRLLEFCCRHDLCITNSFYDTKPQDKVSWRHPRSKHYHQLDLVLTGRSTLRNVKLTRSFQSTDCDTDHSLVVCRVKFQPWKILRVKKEGRPRINVIKTCDLHKVEDFTAALVNALPVPPGDSASERWSHLRGTIFNTAMSICGKRHNKSADWFERGRPLTWWSTLRLLQEKCREERKALYIAFIDLTKAFDLVSRDGLFKILAKIGCPRTLFSMIQSFHKDMKGTVMYDGSTSEPFNINSGVKQGCVLAPTLFGIFFAILVKHAFGTTTEGIYLRTRSDGKLYNLSRLRANAKVHMRILRKFLFVDNASLTIHTAEGLQQLLNRSAAACSVFGLTIRLKKTQVMGQDVK